MVTSKKAGSAKNGAGAATDGTENSATQLAGWKMDRLDYPTFRMGLLAKIMDRLTIRQLLEQDEMTYAEWRVLARFATMPDGGTAGQVAELAWVDFAEVSRAVTSLVGRGLLERKRNPADRRASIVSLTEAGRVQYRETQERRSAFHEELLCDLSADERATLDDLLMRIGTQLKGMLKDGSST
ncbi:MarR family winged helix-turn-helix transcriptional regulator [Altericroceibacterium endophyticum]|uniref:MarR family transcriptional regulator n=1 Tax=Altericroceibacterium endophyticum TaxID=1808508 RepID=A0A6I4T667_9SPHN|nr:MarR family winged helix-turn-helix transcriptional regulator [Altericroceibacterium endophyticum]MXO65285.1 MarR family transcriptional regulator [Altericroceibacterium endophyticum]